MRKKDFVGLDAVFIATNKIELKKKFKLMDAEAFTEEMLMRFRWELSETAIDIFRSILQLKTEIFFHDLYLNLSEVAKAPLRSQIDKVRKYEEILQKRIQHVFFITPGFGDFSGFKKTVAALHSSAESMRFRHPKNREIDQNFSAKRINQKIKRSFYGALGAVEIAIKLKFQGHHGAEFRRFLEHHILADADLLKVLRRGIKLSKENELSYEHFMRTYRRNIGAL